jgi:hypothetical protein
MKVILVKNGLVENIIMVESIEKFAEENPPFFNSFDGVVAVDEDAEEQPIIGWRHDGTKDANGKLSWEGFSKPT